MKKCLNPNCKRAAGPRGLCTPCYQSARKLVIAGRTTWENLEKNGKCLASPVGRKPGDNIAWLLSEADK